VAVIGATEKPPAWPDRIAQPAGAAFRRHDFPINRTARMCWASGATQYCGDGEVVDLAIVITPAATVPAVLQECLGCGVRGAIVISAGFAELGAEGKELEKKSARYCRQDICG